MTKPFRSLRGSLRVSPSFSENEMKTASDIPWLVKAQGYIGIKGATDLKINPLVVKFFREAEEIPNDPDEPGIGITHVAWCAAFVGAVLKECGLPHTGSLLALSYVDYGQKLEEPLVGAIATKKREGGGHVFFVSSFDKKFIYGLGGNQHDEVSIERFPRSQIVSYSWPVGVEIPS